LTSQKIAAAEAALPGDDSGKPSFFRRLELLWKTWMRPCAQCEADKGTCHDCYENRW
jgi:hypothetical protein